MLSDRLDLTERIAIEFGLGSGKTFKQIAERLHKSPSSIGRAVKANREVIWGTFFLLFLSLCFRDPVQNQKN